jgi:class 3 adenylate cyclase
MSVSGNWILHFSWGCTNSYSQSNVTFNANRTFGGTLPGKWVQQDGTLLLSFDTGPAKYGGTVDGNVGSGAMSTFAGLNGCWYLTKEGTAGIAAATAAAPGPRPQYDAAGNKT